MKSKTKAVSTHSRPKAAGRSGTIHTEDKQRFNTQPPEGGWDGAAWVSNELMVSTHSRPKAAGAMMTKKCINCGVSTHSRPKAAGE